MDRVPSVSFVIARIATCRGCPEAFEGRTGCHPSVSGCHIEAMQPLFAGPKVGAQKRFRPAWIPSTVSGVLSQAAKDGVPVPSVLPWSTANAIGVALVDLRTQSSTPAVVPGAALPRPRLGRVGGYSFVTICHCLNNLKYYSMHSKHRQSQYNARTKLHTTGELSATLMRRVLQAAARARWYLDIRPMVDRLPLNFSSVEVEGL